MKNSSGIIDGIVENLFHVLPLIHRKLIKIDLCSVDRRISLPHFAIMRVLDKMGPLPVSQVGEKLLIARPQMTSLIDRLVEPGIVERIPDTNDRRVINVRLTDKGKVELKACKDLIKDNVRRKLSCLKDEELKELSVALNRIGEIGSKLE
jgi:DNA-binding MarR family transcriptional regulator